MAAVGRVKKEGAYFLATTPPRADSSLATNGIVLYVIVQRALAGGAAALGNDPAGDGRRNRPPAMPKTGNVWPAPKQGLSTEYPFHRGVYAAGDRLLGRQSARRRGPGTHPRRRRSRRAVPRARFHPRRPSGRAHRGTLIQEIWRPFLAAMVMAMLVEAGLCFPRKRGQNRGTRHERLPIVNLSLDAGHLTCCRSWPCCSRPDSVSPLCAASVIGRPTSRSSRLRFAIVCLAVLLFNQPEWIEEFRPQGKPSIAVLWDASPSMETRDVVRPGGSRVGADRLGAKPSRR